MNEIMRRGLEVSHLRRIYDALAHRYELQHAVITAGSDGRGRRLLVRATVRRGDSVLDAGGGTGLTARLAAAAAGDAGRVVIMDLSRGMLERARSRLGPLLPPGRVSFVIGDIHRPPLRPACFDVVLSTYSVCPLRDPAEGAAALYDLVRPGGLLGVAHSTEPRGGAIGWLADRAERLAWCWPGLSMGCRAVSVLPRLRSLGAVVESDRRIGVPLWPFRVFVVRHPRN
jgi:ubiquinone/menaquinone biosynthesis C-methylase UbiE